MDATVRPEPLVEQLAAAAEGLRVNHPRPLEGRVRLRDQRVHADAHHQPPPAALRELLATRGDHALHEVGDRQHILVTLARQADQEVELHPLPARAERRPHRRQQVLLGHVLVDDVAHPLRARLGCQRQPAFAHTLQTMRQRNAEGVHAQRRQADRHSPVREALVQAVDELPDLRVVRAVQRQQRQLVIAGRGDDRLGLLHERVKLPLAHRAVDHPGLAEAAAAGAAARYLDLRPVMHRLGPRHHRPRRPRLRVKVLDDAARHALRNARLARLRDEQALRALVRGVERRRVDALDGGAAAQ